ncbi:MAG: hypothetical protein ACYTAN_04840 [Planctomycetota bacterium]|jgi:hypothetical protein
MSSPGRRRGRHTDLIILILLALLVMLLFHQVLFSGKVFFFRDFSFFFYPKRHLVTERIRNFDIPFWSQYAGCGEPVLGTYQPAVFYPPAVVYYLLPLPHSFMWFVVAHLFIAGSGMYYMMRAFGVRRPPAAFAAAAWAFSPVFVSTLDNVSFMNSLSWLPWCLFSARRLSLALRWRRFLGLVFTLTMAILAGGPEPVVFILAIVLAYSVFHTLTASVRRRGKKRDANHFSATARNAPVSPDAPSGQSGRGSNRKMVSVPLFPLFPLLVLAALLLALLISGVEIAPLLHSLRWSGRPAQNIKSARHWAARPSDALLWFLPRFYLFPDRGGIYWRSQQWLKTVYMGVAIPFLALWTILAVRRRRNLFFLLLAAFAAALAVGAVSPLWRLLWHYLPGFSLIRFPVKWFLPAAFALAALAGFAVDDFLVCSRRKERLRPLLLVAVIAVTAALFAAGRLAMNSPEAFKALTPPEVAERIVAGDAAAADQAWEQFESARWSLGRSSAFLFALGGALVAAGVLARLKIPRPYGAAAVAAVLFIDVALFGVRLNPVAGAQILTRPPGHVTTLATGPNASRLYSTPAMFEYAASARLARFKDVSGLAQYLTSVTGRPFSGVPELLEWAEDVAGKRFTTLEELDAWLSSSAAPHLLTVAEQEYLREVFHPNLNVLYGVPATNSFEPLLVKWHFDLLNRLRQEKVSAARARYLPVLWGATTVIERAQEPPGFVYLPIRPEGRRALLADRIIPVGGDAEARSVLLETDIDVRKRVILIGRDAEQAAAFLGERSLEKPPEDHPEPGSARVVADSGDELTVEVDAARPALLFLADNWYPNFRATVDGDPAPIWRANYGYRALPVPAGAHTVRFTYVPTEFYLGLAMTVIGLAVLAVIRRLRRGAAGGA